MRAMAAIRRPALLAALVLGTALAYSQKSDLPGSPPGTGVVSDSGRTPANQESQVPLNAWGINILLSNDGFGLGGFYRREFSPDVSGFLELAVSESKDSRETEQYDPFTQITYVPGKLNRFLVMPLMVGIQYRLFREDIVETFRPFLNAAVGPTMIYSAPFAEITQTPTGPTYTQVEFFNSLGHGQAHYTASAFIGAGANFGSDKNNLLGLNFRYYFTYLFGDGLPSLYDVNTGNVVGSKKDFGGFFITLNVGVLY